MHKKCRKEYSFKTPELMSSTYPSSCINYNMHENVKQVVSRCTHNAYTYTLEFLNPSYVKCNTIGAIWKVTTKTTSTTAKRMKNGKTWKHRTAAANVPCRERYRGEDRSVEASLEIALHICSLLVIGMIYRARIYTHHTSHAWCAHVHSTFAYIGFHSARLFSVASVCSLLYLFQVRSNY